MQVETYEVETVSQDEIQQLASEGETAQLIESLGLEGQQQLIGGESIKPFPYRIMTLEEQKVFEIVFPRRTKLQKFSSELIPLRVLQVAAHVNESNFLKKGMWIWHPEDSRHDPLLVGHDAIPDSSYGERYFMLARWGAALQPFKVLLEKAKGVWIAERKSKIMTGKTVIDSLISRVQTDADLFFAGKSVETSVYF